MLMDGKWEPKTNLSRRVSAPEKKKGGREGVYKSE